MKQVDQRNYMIHCQSTDKQWKSKLTEVVDWFKNHFPENANQLDCVLDERNISLPGVSFHHRKRILSGSVVITIHDDTLLVAFALKFAETFTK
jgi:hypothetical protein